MKTTKFRVWYIANVPDKGITFKANSLAEAHKIKDIIIDTARYVEKQTRVELNSDVSDIEVFEDGEWIDLESSSLGE